MYFYSQKIPPAEWRHAILLISPHHVTELLAPHHEPRERKEVLSLIYI